MSRILRWSSDGRPLPLEDCARRGVEALAGLVIFHDVFGVGDSPEGSFCACAIMEHSITGADDDFDDFICVRFLSTEIREGAYPVLGQETVRMVMQPQDDGLVIARWSFVYGPLGQMPRGNAGTLDAGTDTLSAMAMPVTLGAIPPQPDDDAGPPTFLLLRDPGAGWQIWRRFAFPSRPGFGESATTGMREESYVMVYPILDAETCWRFLVRDLPGGGTRVESISRSR